jgi:hypothetical protein
MDKGYDVGRICDGCEGRDCRPIIPLRKTPAVLKGDHKPPTCEHGTWTFAGADYQRKATKWRCPTGVQARLPIGQGRSAAPAGPARVEPLDRPVPGPKALSSASSGDSRTSGRCLRSASVGWIGYGCTPT